METRTCQSCQAEFTIEPEDFAFYQKIDVPPPTWCPDCRTRRRYAWRNERVLYRRNCDLCGKTTVSIYSPNKPWKVYCAGCWWSDAWDGKEFGRDFDFSRPFFEQFAELQREVPRIALLNKNSVNSEYTNHAGDNKNCYLCFTVFDGENDLYSTDMYGTPTRDCADCYHITSGGELLYECVDTEQSYGCQYGLLLRNCRDCHYCFDLHGCSDCVLSYGLRNKQYYIENKSYSKEEYEAKLRELNLSSFETRERLYAEWLAMITTKAPHRFAVIERSQNVTGNQLLSAKNSSHCFDGNDIEDSKSMHMAISVKDSHDLYHVGFATELAYECHGCSTLYDSQFCHLSYDNAQIEYCDTCHNSRDLFGCQSLKNSRYCILNKEYPEDEYHALRAKIVEHMKQRGEYGEFFPPKYAPIGYNETQGQVYLPLTKDEVLARGWTWEEQTPGTFGKETLQPEAIPDDIMQVEDSIVGEVLTCVECNRNYNLIELEFQFYRQGNIPIPRRCPECRYRRRLALRPPRKLWHRQCTCTLGTHDHDSGQCSQEFETPYSPDREEIVYCESCYQAELT